MNGTPASTQSIAQGTVYTSQRSGQPVKLLAKPDGNCTIQVGTYSPV